MRQAILKAADSIERFPSLFDFNSLELPGKCGTPGCAIGWIAAHTPGISRYVDPEARNYVAGPHNRTLMQTTSAMLKVEHSEFYERMNELDGYSDPPWNCDASRCAHVLRKYADKYHPAPVLPESVRKIFDAEFNVEEIA